MNAVIATRLDAGREPAMSLGRVLRAYLNETRCQFMQALRAPAFTFPFLLLPVPLYLFFGVVMVGASPEAQANPALANAMFSGWCCVAVMGPAIFSFGIGIAMERDANLLKLKRALPLPAGSYLIAKILMSVAFAALAVGTVTIAALAVGKITLSAGQLVTMLAVLVIGAVPFSALGLLIGAYSTAGASPAFANLVYLPGIWLAGLFFPLPAFLRPFAVMWPAFHLNQTALGLAGVKEFSFMPPAMTAAVLVGMTVLFGGLALRRLARVG
jgi:ABC-2 type transport system permease protein